MRRLWMIFAVGVAARAAVACAADGSDPLPPIADGDPFDSGPIVVPPSNSDASDAGDANDGSAPDAAAVDWCSDAGWCTTPVPDPAIRFFALVPFEQRALALAWVAGRTTPLVFDGNQWNVIANDAWVAFPKDKQLLYALAAPNEREIWLGGAHGFLAHGVDTSGTWAFTTVDLGTTETVQSIFVTDATEVFVATDTRVYHNGGDAGDAWSIEHEAPVIDEEVKQYNPSWVAVPASFYALVGSGADDVWLFGRRGGCGYVAHRTSDGWSTVSDALGLRYFPGAEYVVCFGRVPYPSTNALTSPNVTVQGEFVALTDDVIVEGRLDESGFSVASDGLRPQGTNRLWLVPGSAERYLIGYATVMSNPDMNDGGTWGYSTISSDGKTPTLKTFETIGGTSKRNMWVAGESYALHRTLP